MTTMTQTYREALNPAQREAATWDEGPVLVIAGAGSGKTRTLVHRVAYLIEKGVPPEQILLLTFTRKAAQEMLLRAADLLHFSCHHVMGGTFHAVANIILRRHGWLLQYPPRFTIIDRADSEDIVKLLKAGLDLGAGDKQFPSKRLIINAFGKAVNKAVPIQRIIEDEYEHLAEYLDDLLAIHQHYGKFKLDHGLMDYDDLLTNWLRLLQDHDDVRRELSERFRYILVDEYQDTNPVQAAIVKLLAGPQGNVMAVGDDSQSIYSFRGADFRNIMNFPNIFPSTRVIRLEENYRSTKAILSVANTIIENAREKYTKTLFTKNEEGQRPFVYPARDEKDQSLFIINKIRETTGQGVPLSEIAVLFRAGYQSFKLEIELAAAGINFEKRGGLKLTETAHIKDVLAHLRVVTNGDDYLSWNRILLLIDRVGPKTAEKAIAVMRGAQSPLDGLRSHARGKAWGEGLERLLDAVAKAHGADTPLGAIAVVLDYYDAIFKRVYHDDYPRRQRDLDQLRSVIADYAELQTFLDEAALDPPEAPPDSGDFPGSSGGDRLVLSTVHSAKGLEWDTVFIIHLVEGKFPMANESTADEYEEERRLFYVAVTRARKRLHLIHPRYLVSYDQNRYATTISPFLAEIPPSKATILASSPSFLDPFLDPFHGTTPRSKPKTPALSTGMTANIATLQKGARVRHGFFGDGVVADFVNPHTVAVDFARHGRKNLHLDYAKLEILP